MTDPVSAPISVESVIARIPEWEGKDVLCQELGGGITNRNYVATVDGEPGAPGVGKFVIRIPGEGTDTFIDRERELSNHRAAAAAGVTPPLLHVIQPGDCTVVPFIEGETMHPESIAGHPDRLEKIVDAMRTYHDKAVFTNEIRVFDMIREYHGMQQDVGAPRPPETDWMQEQGARIEDAMKRDAPPFTASHNDLLSENFILAPDGKMWIIDWEYGGMTDPYFDLGDHVMEHPYSREEERLIIETYLGEMDERLFGRMMLYKIVSAVWWDVWAMIQHTVSKIDFDYMEWAMDRVGRAERGIADPDYQKWLAAQ